MINPQLTKWSLAFSAALLGHAAIAFSFSNTVKPEMERASGTPIEIVGSLAALAASEPLKELEGESETAEELTEEPVMEEQAAPLTTEEESQALTPLPVAKQLEEAPEKPDQPQKPLTKHHKSPKPKATKSTRQKAQKASRQNAALRKGGGAKGKRKNRAGAAVRANYHGRIQSHLARHKRRAAGRGRALIRFSISRSGRVTAVRLVKRSGNTAVDQAALAMVRRASPFPPIPAGMKSGMTFTVPVHYR